MTLDLSKLEKQLDDALAKETPESLNEFMNIQRNSMKREYQKVKRKPKGIQVTGTLSDSEYFNMAQVSKHLGFKKPTQLVATAVNHYVNQHYEENRGKLPRH